MKNKHIIPHLHAITLVDRIKVNNHKPLVLWFTGLSGSGKSTIAGALEEILNRKYSIHTYLLDGDNIRTGLNKDLGFSETDRQENIRRIGEVSKLMYDAGLIVITAFISPFKQDREKVRQLLPENAFWEIYVDCPLEVCEQRDPKGLYKKARKGEIQQFTGINSPYEKPDDPKLVVSSYINSVDECVQSIVNQLIKQKIIG